MILMQDYEATIHGDDRLDFVAGAVDDYCVVC